MKTKKSLLALAFVSMFAFAAFAATSVENNNDDDNKITMDKKRVKVPGQQSA